MSVYYADGEKFGRVYGTSSKPGSGLGLYIAREIVNQHGGSIRAESNSPKGARFILSVPVMEPVTAAGQNGAEADTVEPVKEVRS